MPWESKTVEEVRKEFIIPQINGYQVLKGDFHLHTDYSDGCVWPDYRVREAWYNGLDVIAITDHIEVLSHDEELDMKKFDYNTSGDICRNFDFRNGEILPFCRNFISATGTEASE